MLTWIMLLKTADGDDDGDGKRISIISYACIF